MSSLRLDCFREWLACACWPVDPERRPILPAFACSLVNAVIALNTSTVREFRRVATLTAVQVGAGRQPPAIQSGCWHSGSIELAGVFTLYLIPSFISAHFQLDPRDSGADRGS